MANGVAQRDLYLSVYDFGRIFLEKEIGLGMFPASALGFTLFFIYSGLIHTKFWDPLALPEARRKGAMIYPSWHVLEVLAMLLTWLVPYEKTGDVASLCALHAMEDFMLAWATALPPPF